MARRHSGGSGGLVLGAVLLIGVAILVIKWLLITALILAVPFGAWWLYDRRRRPAPIERSDPSRLHVPAPTEARPTVPHASQASWVVPPISRASTTATPAPTTAPAHLLSADGRVVVAGESRHQSALRRAAGGAVAGDDPPRHIRAEALLVPDPENTHDHDAVRVDLMSERYRDLVRATESRGRTPRCEAVVTYGERGFQVDLRMPSVP